MACNMLNQYGPLVGRILLALIFIVSGFGKITGWDGTLGYMASQGIPMTSLFLALAIIIELGGGLMIAFGFQARWAALAIFLFLIPTSVIFHNFWTLSGPDAFTQMIQFEKNLAIMGGMLYLMTFGSGPYSLQQEKC